MFNDGNEWNYWFVIHIFLYLQIIYPICIFWLKSKGANEIIKFSTYYSLKKEKSESVLDFNDESQNWNKYFNVQDPIDFKKIDE